MDVHGLDGVGPVGSRRGEELSDRSGGSGEGEEETAERREAARAQIGFYASTPTYRTVLEAHGWEPVGERLGALAREKKWREMPPLVTDEMLDAFVVEAAPEELGAAVQERYEGLKELALRAGVRLQPTQMD